MYLHLGSVWHDTVRSKYSCASLDAIHLQSGARQQGAYAGTEELLTADADASEVAAVIRVPGSPPTS